MRLRTQLLMGYVLVFAIILVIAGATHRSVESLLETANSVAHTHRVIAHGNLIQRLLADMENGERGFLITGIDEFLERYEEGRHEFTAIMTEVKALVSDNDIQIDRLEEIDRLVAEWHRVAASPEIAARREVKEGSAPAANVTTLIEKATGKSVMDELRDTLTEFGDVEKRLLLRRRKEAQAAADWSISVVLLGSLLAITLGVGSMLVTTRTILRQVGGDPAAIASITREVAQGRLGIAAAGDSDAATGILASVREMVGALRRNQEAMERQDWLKAGVARINEIVRGQQQVGELCAGVISEVATHLAAPVGAIYLLMPSQEGDSVLSLMGGFAHSPPEGRLSRFRIGEGTVGQAALERRRVIFRDVFDAHMDVHSGFGKISPRQLVAMPFLYEDEVKGVLEIGGLVPFTDLQLEYLEQIAAIVSINVHTAQRRKELAETLDASQTLAQELQQANSDLEAKTEQLAEASRYKSEFLANMSHELRTPLNSLLLLSKSLLGNRDGNLTDTQLLHVGIIRDAGEDLFALINDLLDLSKIEAGRMRIHVTDVPLTSLKKNLMRTFSHLAEQKGLTFDISFDAGLPPVIRTDQQRLEQILKNLISNALKFTETGRVSLHISGPSRELSRAETGLPGPRRIAFSVEDTGIGISPDEQNQIFEAFNQGVGATIGELAGTGLGLTIADQLANRLGGAIHVRSTAGLGSTFTLLLPARLVQDDEQGKDPSAEEAKSACVEPAAPPPMAIEGLETLNDALRGRHVLTVDDDVRSLYAIEEALRGFDVHVLKATDGPQALSIVETTSNLDMVLLDVMMPGMDGFDVLRELRSRRTEENLPVIAVTGKAMQEDREKLLAAGANGYVTKPVDLARLLATMRAALGARDKDRA